MENDYFYHYTTIEGLRGIIENECLWATESCFLNDSSENYYYVSLITQVSSKNPLFEEVFKHLYNESYKSIFFDYNKYITSMSKSQDSLSMWNLYTKGNGFCIKFLKQNLFNIQKHELNMEIIDIVYDSEKQKENLIGIFETYVKRLPDIRDLNTQLDGLLFDSESEEYSMLSQCYGQIVVDFMNDLFKNRNSYKHPAYKEECETRIVTEHDIAFSADKDRYKFRTTPNGQIIEFIELPINIRNIKAIMLHPFICDEVHSLGLRKYLFQNGLPDVLIYNSSIPFRGL